MVTCKSSQIVQYFRNCLSVHETLDGLVPLRFSQEQFSVYARTELFRQRSLCTAGVTLDIVSNSPSIQLDYSIRSFARDWVYFDIFLDGVFVESIGAAPINAQVGFLRYEPAVEQGTVHRITIYLPHNAELVINGLSFMEGSFVEPAPRPGRRILCLGDSITQGMAARHPSSTYPVLLSRTLDAELINQGVGGYVFEKESLEGFPEWIPDIVTIAYGTNDWMQRSSASEFEKKCTDYLVKASRLFASAQIIVITPLHRMDASTARVSGNFASIGETIKRVCSGISGHDIGGISLVVDGSCLVPHQSRFFDDGLHPTDEGFMQLFRNLAPSLLSV
jgi:lysophospholipase L1-like esterase